MLQNISERRERPGQRMTTDSTKSEARNTLESTVLRVPPPSPDTSPKLSLEGILSAPGTATFRQPPRRIDIHGYCYPGAPEDIWMFNYLWAIRGYQGKTEVWQNPSPRSQEIISSTSVHAMMMETRRLGGYDALDRNPALWKELAFRLRLLESRSQKDERATEVIDVVQRINKVWLRSFEQYCRDWPSVPVLEKDALVATLNQNLAELGQVPGPVIHRALPNTLWNQNWPPSTLDPITPGTESQVAYHLYHYAGPGVPADRAVCFYMMKLWCLSSDPDRAKKAPLLPQPLPDAFGEVIAVNYYTMSVEINNLGGPEEILRVPGSWARLAVRLRLIEREDQSDVRSNQILRMLAVYFRDYLVYFGIFCDQWPSRASDARKQLIESLIKERGSRKSGKQPEQPRKVPRSAQVFREGSDSGSSESGTTTLLPPTPQLTGQVSVDLISYNIPGVPKDYLVLNYFLRMWYSEMGWRLGPLPAWKGVHPSINIQHVHAMIDGYGGIDTVQRVPELWAEIAIQMKLAVRSERGSERMEFLIDTLKYVYREMVVPFERFCNEWPNLARDEKAEHINKLIRMLQDIRSGIPIPPSPDSPTGFQADALAIANLLEQGLKGFCVHKSFEERIQRLQMLLPHQAAQLGVNENMVKLSQQLSEESVKTMATVLAGAPSSSRPIQINIARTVVSPCSKAEAVPATFASVAGSSLWSESIIQAAGRCLQEVMRRVNESRATDLSPVELPQPEQVKVKHIVRDTYSIALEFYHYAIFHIMLHSKGQWTEFLMRQACLVLEQYFLSRVGSPVFIITLEDAQLAKRILRDEVDKIKTSYASRALEKELQKEKGMNGRVRLNVPAELPSLSANA